MRNKGGWQPTPASKAEAEPRRANQKVSDPETNAYGSGPGLPANHPPLFTTRHYRYAPSVAYTKQQERQWQTLKTMDYLFAASAEDKTHPTGSHTSDRKNTTTLHATRSHR